MVQVSSSGLTSTTRGHPCGKLSARIEAHLVQDVADVILDCSFGYEQPGANLLVGQSVSDQLRDLRLTLCKRSRSLAVQGFDGSACRLFKGQRNSRIPRQVLSRIELSVEDTVTER